MKMIQTILMTALTATVLLSAGCDSSKNTANTTEHLSNTNAGDPTQGQQMDQITIADLGDSPFSLTPTLTWNWGWRGEC